MVQFDKTQARFKTVTLKFSTGKGEDKKPSEAQVEVPATLDDAVLAEGKKKVFRRYISSLAIELQGDFRSELKEKRPGEKKKRASYIEELEL